MASSPREQLIATAIRLFNRHGYHATGIDRILGDAGVAKMTLYKHFGSKDELILAALHARDQWFRTHVRRELSRRTADPAERLVLLFDVIDEYCKGSEFNGCMFVNAASEFPEPESSIRAAAAEHKRLFTSYIREQAEAAGAAQPGALAERLALLAEGAIATAHVRGDADASARAKELAQLVVGQAIAEPGPRESGGGPKIG
jgi:AcrR family transcriptional regulator